MGKELFEDMVRHKMRMKEKTPCPRCSSLTVEGLAKVINNWMNSTCMDTGDPLDGARMIAKAVLDHINVK